MFRCLWFFAVILAAPCWAAEQIYSTQLGATGSAVTAMATDPQGNAYLAGTTNDADFPVTPGAFQTRLKIGGPSCIEEVLPCSNAFVAKLDPAGKIVWATFLGGSRADVANGIAFDSGGNVYAAGWTQSPDFPATTTTASGVTAVFVAKLSPDGSSLIYSFLFDAMNIAGVAVDPSGHAYVAGWAGANTTTTPGAFQTQPRYGATPAYVGKVNAAGSGWDYLTFLGASGADTATGIAVNANGEAYVAGATFSANFPGAVRGAQKALIGDTDAFVAKLNASGSGIFWSTYLGVGADSEAAVLASVTLDASGSVYAASTGAATAPTLCKLSPDGSAFVYSKRLPIDTQYSASIAVSASGEVYLGGNTSSQNLPVTPGALEGGNYIGLAGYVLEYDATGSNVLYGSYFSGGSLWEAGLQGIGLDAAGHLYMAGYGTLDSSAEWGNVVKADLTATPPIWLAAVRNSASYASTVIAPGELVALFGTGIGPVAPVAAQVVDGKLPTQIGGVEVLVNGVPAPLLYVSSGQINAVVPFGVPATAEFMVALQGESSNVVGILTMSAHGNVGQTGDLGVFTSDGSGQGQAAALNQDGTLNSASNPAPRGSIVAIWLTGTGNSDPPETDGEITPIGSQTRLSLPLVVNVGGSAAQVTYAGAAPGLVAGVDQVNFRIPEDADTGPAVRLTVTPYGPAGPLQSLTIAVR